VAGFSACLIFFLADLARAGGLPVHLCALSCYSFAGLCCQLLEGLCRLGVAGSNRPASASNPLWPTPSARRASLSSRFVACLTKSSLVRSSVVPGERILAPVLTSCVLEMQSRQQIREGCQSIDLQPFWGLPCSLVL